MNRADRYDRRPAWKQAVRKSSQLHSQTKSVMWVLYDHMRPDGKVSVSRATVALELGWRNPRRVTYHLAAARHAGFLITVIEGAHGRTATWQAVFPGDTRWRKTSHLVSDQISPPSDPLYLANSSPPITKANPSQWAQTATFAVMRRAA